MDEDDFNFWSPAYTNGCNNATTADVTMEGALAAMRRMEREFDEADMRDHGLEGRMLVVMDHRCSAHRRVTLRQLRDWARGIGMPSFLKDFDGWWLATLVKHRTVNLYSIEIPKPFDYIPMTPLLPWPPFPSIRYMTA